MNKPCGNPHPLTNAGSVQGNRAPHVLAPSAVPYDERTMSDWLVFLAKYAGHVNFFASADGAAASGDWTAFYTQDISVLLARIAEEQVAFLQKQINQTLLVLQHDDVTNSEAKEKFTQLFGSVLNIVWRLNEYHSNLEPKLAFKEAIENRVFTHIEVRLSRLISYLKAAQVANLLDVAADQNQPAGYKPVLEMSAWPMSKLWYQRSAQPSWADFYNSIPADDSPFKHNLIVPANDAAKINLAARYQLLVEAVKGTLSAFSAIINSAQNTFNETVNNWPDHKPDRALLLSFLHLLEFYREEINTLPQRHLDYYYKDVLQLRNQPAVADSVFLVAELAKNQSQVLLPSGTQCSGGKDDEGVERIYATTENSVLNTAKVVAQKAILRKNGYVFAAQNVATADGLEQEFEHPEQGWPPFGTPAMPQAEIGFAVASDHLFLKDGTRTVNIIITAQQAFVQSTLNTLKNRCVFRITGEKGWIALSSVNMTLNDTKKILTISGSVKSDEGAVVAINPEIHGRSFYQNLPVAELLVDSRDHNYLQTVEVLSVQVSVNVTDSKQHAITTNNGLVDATKPFQAFGPQPAKGNSLVFDAQEMLAKNLENFKLNLRWATPDSDERDYATFRYSSTYLQFQQLNGNAWENKTVVYSQSGEWAIAAWSGLLKQKSANASFGPKSTSGFVRLALKYELGHAGYPVELTRYMVQVAKNPAAADPNAAPKPYTIPVLDEVSISYAAKTSALNVAQSSAYQTQGTVFYHITPFGGYEASGNALAKNHPTLLPHLPNEGELYIGISGFGGGQSVQLLVHVLEGSANPLKAKQEITWQYLHHNRWLNFENGNLQDGTEGLIKTGLLTLALPFDFADNSSFFGTQNVWIRATIAQHTDAVCRVVGVYAQGLKAVLVSQNHSAAHYQNPLAAGTVTKFKVSNPAIKKIMQPATSRGGKAAEEDHAYYTRVSERLRHKNRAVSLWDFERLALNEFPELSMVKTLTHTKYVVDEVTNALDYSESAPGHVALVCVPQKPVSTQVLLKPFTPVDVLEEVKKQAQNHMPAWATLHVRNPLFEEVQVDCRVKFRPEIKDTAFYLDVLHQDLQAFLSPWAGTNAQALKFGWRVHKSSIINFIDERPYIDFVRDVKINLIYGQGTNERMFNVDEAVPRFAISVLSSSANHVLNLV